MLEIRTIAEANAALLPYVPLVRQLSGQGTSLAERDRPMMRALGDPQNKLRVVHVAGTSGKTSTSYYTAALLQAAAKKVGLTVSPHVDSVTERVQINGQPLSEELFCRYLGEFLDLVERQPLKPSYFTLLYAFAFWVFEREAVDYAVIETGLGGLLDATNTADRADKLCVITDIGFDHMHILGDSLAEIAAQKIGIVHEHNAVIMYEQTREVMDVVHEWTREHQASLMTTTEADELAALTAAGLGLAADMPQFQRRNWLLAYKAYQFLQARDGLPALDAEPLRVTQALQVPGRMDRRQVVDDQGQQKIIIMDGAHNGQKMATFLHSFQLAYPGVKPAVMIALKQGKEPTDVAPLLTAVASEIIITTFDTSQDLPAKSIDPYELAQIFHDAGAQRVSVVPDHHQAYKQLLASTTEINIITGSFYLLSQLRDRERLMS